MKQSDPERILSVGLSLVVYGFYQAVRCSFVIFSLIRAKVHATQMC